MASDSWVPNADGNWNVATNWSTGLLPAATDDVVLSTAAVHTVTHSTGSHKINSLTATTDGLALTGGALSVITTAKFGHGLTQTGGTLSLGGASSVTGSFQQTTGAIGIASGVTFSLSGPSSFGQAGGYGGSIDGPGTLATSGVTTLVDGGGLGAFTLDGGAVWANSGTVVAAGMLDAGDGKTAAVQNSGLFNLTTDDAGVTTQSYFNGVKGISVTGTATFANTGTLEKTGGSGTSVIQAALTNSGTIAVASGTIQLAAGGTIGGTLTGAGELELAAGIFKLGSIASPAHTILLLDGGTDTVAANATVAANLQQTAGSLGIAAGATLTLTGPASFGSAATYGASIDGPGTLATTGVTTIVDAGSLPEFILDGGGSWKNAGTVNDGGVIGAGDAKIATIVNTGVFNLTSDDAGIVTQSYYDVALGSYITGTATIANTGTFAKTAGSAISALQASFSNASTGTISVASGTLEFDDGGTINGTVKGVGTIALAGGTFANAGITSLTGGILIDGAAVAFGTATVAGSFSETSGAASFAKSATATGAFQLTGGAITLAAGATLTVSGPATFGSTSDYGGSIDGPGVLATSGATTIADLSSGATELILDNGGSWKNTGTVSAAGLIGAGDAKTATISNSGVFNLTTDDAGIATQSYYNPQLGQYVAGVATIANTGTFGKVGGSGTSYVQGILSNTGTLNAASGTLELDGGGTIGGVVKGSGVLAFGGGTFNAAGITSLVDAGLAIDGGTVSFGALPTVGALSETAGVVKFTKAATVLGATAINGGTLTIASGAVLTLSGASNLDQANIVGPGTLATGGTTSFADLYLDGSLHWTNTGTVKDAGTILAGYPSQAGTIAITNAAGGVFDLTADGENVELYGGAPLATFANAGTLAKTGGTDISDIGARVTNTGVIAATTGTLQFDAGGTFGGTIGGAGTIAFAGGTAALATGGQDSFTGLTIDGGTVTSADAIVVTGHFTQNSGALTMAAGKSFSAAGFSQTAGSLTLGAAATLTNATIGGTVSLAGVTLTLSGTSNLDQANIIGPGTLATGGTTSFTDLYLDGSLHWTNSGTVKDAGTVLAGYPSQTGTIAITNAAGGVFDLTVDGGGVELYGATPSVTFANAGTFAKTGGTGVSDIYASVNNTGTIAATTGTLQLDDGGTLGGTIGGTTSKGAVTLASGSFATTSTVTIADDGTANGLVLGNGETWSDSGTILEAGHLLIGTSTGSPTVLAIGTGAALDLVSNDGTIATKGTATITNAGTIATLGVTGRDIIGVGIANTGLIDAASGTLALSGAVSGTGAMRIEAGSTLELGAAPATTQAITFNGAGATLKLDKPATYSKPLLNFGAGDRIDLAGVVLTAAGVSGNTLTLSNGTTNYVFTSAASLANDHVQYASDGAGGTMVTLYAEAQASAHLPEPVTFANAHVGGTATQFLTLANTAPTGAEGLDASLGTATTGFTTTGFTTTGTVSRLAPGASDATSLAIKESTTTAGTLSGNATLSLSSDGTGIDGFGTTALPSQTVTMTGAVYAYAAPVLSAGTVNLGAVRVGGTLAAGSVTLRDGSAASGYQESLVYGASGATGLTITGGSGTVASGGTATLGLGFATTTARDFTGSKVTLALTSTGAGTSGLADTALAAQSVTVNGKVYALAKAGLAANTLNIGIVHVGDTTAASKALAVTNTGTGALVDQLTAGTATTTGSVSSVGYALGTGLAAGASGSLQIGINTATAGTVSGSAVIGFKSHDADLADQVLAAGTVAVSGTVDNYAVSQVEKTGGVGALTTTASGYTLDLGSVTQGGGALTATLGVINAASGTADVLSGSFAASVSSAYTNTGLTAFSGLAAGADERNQSVSLATGTAGVFTETIVLTPTGSNASGYSGVLAKETVTVTGTVVSSGSTYTLTGAPATITGTTGNDVLNVVSNALNSHDAIDLAGGTNTLNLGGGGFFDLGAPKTLANIGTVTAQESGAGTTVYMRDGLNTTLAVAPGGSGTLTIYGGNDSDIYNLGAGTDKVVLGASSEAVHGSGTGTGLVQATAAFAGALVTGGTAGSTGVTTLEVTNGGTATLNAADSNLVVTLDAATVLGLGAGSFITVVGAAAGHDKLTAGGANQTLESIGGNEMLIGSSSFGDTFLGTANGFAGDTITGFGGTDSIDLTDISAATFKSLTYTGQSTTGSLVVADGSHSATITMAGSYTAANFLHTTDGHGGTLITFTH